MDGMVGKRVERLWVNEHRILDDDAMPLHRLPHRPLDRRGSGPGYPKLLRLPEALRKRDGAEAVGG